MSAEVPSLTSLSEDSPSISTVAQTQLDPVIATREEQEVIASADPPSDVKPAAPAATQPEISLPVTMPTAPASAESVNTPSLVTELNIANTPATTMVTPSEQLPTTLNENLLLLKRSHDEANATNEVLNAPVPSPSVDLNRFEIPESNAYKAAKGASQWNGLLRWARRARGPQWDWSTGM